MSRTATYALAALAALLLAAQGGQAFPWLWAAEAKTCTAHPAGPAARHKAPIADVSIDDDVVGFCARACKRIDDARRRPKSRP